MNNTNIKNITNKKRGFSPKDAVAYAISILQSTVPGGVKREEAIESILNKISLEFNSTEVFSQDTLKTMATEIYNQAFSIIKAEQDTLAAASAISPTDLDLVNNLIIANADSIKKLLTIPAVSSTPSFQYKKILNLILAFTAHALTAYHHSGWIRYDRKEIFNLANINRLSSSIQESLVQQIHGLFGLDMRVIGSNQPIPCYNLPWLIPPSAPTDTLLSTLDPTKIIISLRTAIEYENA